MNIKLPTPEDLAPLYREAMEDQSEEQWQDTFIKSIAKLIKKNPKWYIAYGYYWWGVKQLLIERNLINAEHIDAEWLEKVRFDSPVYLLLAAFAHHNRRGEMWMLYDHTHEVRYEDGLIDEYTLIDEELEAMAIAKKLSR